MDTAKALPLPRQAERHPGSPDLSSCHLQQRRHSWNEPLTGVLTDGWRWRTLQPAHCRCTWSAGQPVTELVRQRRHTPEDSKHILVRRGGKPGSTSRVHVRSVAEQARGGLQLRPRNLGPLQAGQRAMVTPVGTEHALGARC